MIDYLFTYVSLYVFFLSFTCNSVLYYEGERIFVLYFEGTYVHVQMKSQNRKNFKKTQKSKKIYFYLN